MKPKHTQVPMSTKVFFGLGMLAMQMFPAALGVFMVVLVQDFGFDPVMWGLIFFLPRVVDAITDPIMGFISIILDLDGVGEGNIFLLVRF